MAKRRIKNFSVAVAVTLLGRQLEIAFIPFRWSRIALRFSRDSYLSDSRFDFHFYAGPFHIWTMSGLSAFIGFDISFQQNPFHGGALLPRRAALEASHD